MKLIRKISAVLLMVTGIAHIFLAFGYPEYSEIILMLLFGVAYFISGLSLILKPAAGEIMGMIFPMAGLLSGIFFIGPGNWNAQFCFLFAIDAFVLISCFCLRFAGRKEK
ncbi:MAG: hypothetical protein NTX43_08055 [Bacteroidetes bacterium]|nr:hypothetical protein [Bacteroidota bacterium]